MTWTKRTPSKDPARHSGNKSSWAPLKDQEKQKLQFDSGSMQIFTLVRPIAKQWLTLTLLDVPLSLQQRADEIIE